ncbi:MAG: radical SAM/SPASM domain-containing protein [Acidimicrobiales bacterium]
MLLGIDFEVTNRCNASCHFCPRDATPHQGLMTPEVFEQSLVRAHEWKGVAHEHFGGADMLQVRLCGLGEPLINRHLPSYVERVRETGLAVSVSSNAALLDERRGAALLEAGLQEININIADLEGTYEDVYNLPFQRTLDNILRFRDMAGDDCTIVIVLVDYKRDQAHVDAMKDFWRGHGLDRFMGFDIINRGGALFVDEMQYADYPELDEARAMLTDDGGEANCVIPFIYPFIGYDGIYYLCCSDWKKEAPMGDVFERSLADVLHDKYDFVNSRRPVCITCNHDPTNALTDELRAIGNGVIDDSDLDSFVANLKTQSEAVVRCRQTALDVFGPPQKPAGRRSIPVSAT